MKKIGLFLSIVFLAFNLFSQQQIENSNFENWIDNNNLEVWNSGYNLGFYTLPSVEKSSDAIEGNFSAKIYSQEAYGYLLPGYIMLGTLDLENNTIEGGQPFTSRPSAFRVFVKFNPVDTDNFVILGFLTKYYAEDNKRDTIGATAFFYYSDSTFEDYKELVVPFFYNDSVNNPDSINFIFVVSFDTASGKMQKYKSSKAAGSALYIDSLEFLYGNVVVSTYALAPKDVNDKSFVAQWLPISYAIGYQVDVATDENFENILPDYNSVFVDSLSLLVEPDYENLGNKYYYRVRVVYDTAVSENSNIVPVELTFATQCLYPDDISENAFTARWLAQPNADAYLLDVAYDRDFTSFVDNLENFELTDTFYNVSNLEVDDSVFYRVRVRYLYGNLSDYSNVIALKTSTAFVQDNKPNITIIQNKNQVSIMINEPKNYDIKVFDYLGKNYFSTNTKDKNTIQFTLPSKGIYIIKFENQDGYFYKKLVIF